MAGMELFPGTFASCTVPSLTTRETCVPPAKWLNPPFGSFDNVFEANLLLFVASTGDMWQTVRRAVVRPLDYIFVSLYMLRLSMPMPRSAIAPRMQPASSPLNAHARPTFIL
jgi:hypothetical protein